MISDALSWCWEKRNLSEDYGNPSLMLSLVALLAIPGYIFLFRKSKIENDRLPPGPRGLPFVGNLPFLEPDLHSYFSKLAKTYGPVFKLRLGAKLCFVCSSPSVAKEVLKDQDLVFADRYQSSMGMAASYGGMDIANALYGDHWRMLRKLCVQELVSPARLEALYKLRRREAKHMVNQIYSKIGSPVSIGEDVLITMFNIITSMMWGSTLEKEERSTVTAEFRGVAQQMVRLVGEANISDFFPLLASFDLQGKERKMKKTVLWFDKIFHNVIDRPRQMDNERDRKGKGKEDMDFLQILLQLIYQGDQKTSFTITHLKALFVDMTIAGTKTISTTVEWAMTELVNQPEMMRKIEQELEEVVGMNNLVEESHLTKLLYLEAVVKEVLRLHPPAPLLVPRCPRQSSTVGGYMIPKGSEIFVNVWVIQRDPMYWKTPMEFRPERFLNSKSKWSFNGTDFRYIPFGSGRRICVGTPIAERLVPYLLATLLHSFEWKLQEGVKLDFSEAFGIELTKKYHLWPSPDQDCWIPSSTNRSIYVPQHKSVPICTLHKLGDIVSGTCKPSKDI